MLQCKLVMRGVLVALFLFTLMAISPAVFPQGTALAQGNNPQDIEPEPQEPDPSFEFFKLVNSQDANTLESAVVVEPGSNLVFRYEVSNSGNVTLTWSSLVDDVFGDLSAECSLPRQVGVGAVEACEITRPAGEFPDGRQNTGTATVVDLDPQQDVAWYQTPAVQPEPNPSFNFVKLVNSQDADSLEAAPLVPIGANLLFQYQVVNTGDVPIQWATLNDDVFGDLSAECGLPISVPVGGTETCDVTRPAGDYVNGRQNVGTAVITDLPPQQNTAWYRTPPVSEPEPEPEQPVTPPVPIPEPITIVLFGTGLAALSAAAASRRKGQD